MALQINRGLTTQDGGVVASGSHVVFTTKFPPRGLKYNISFQIYRSFALMESGSKSLNVNEIPTKVFSKTLTLQEFAELTPVIIHNHLKEFLEEFLGDGNVAVVL